MVSNQSSTAFEASLPAGQLWPALAKPSLSIARATGPRLLVAFLMSLIGLMFSGEASARWQIIEHEGRDYVTLKDLRTFYGFQNYREHGGSVHLENSRYVVEFNSGKQECYMNRVKFVLSFPIVRKGEHHLLSRLDLVKIIDPIMRPKKIGTARPFRTVILDPGHGGKDPGAINNYGTEKYYNLKLAKVVKTILEKRGYNVVMTRSGDTYLSLEERVALANKYSNAIFISLHFNTGAKHARGLETFTLSPVGTTSHQNTRGTIHNKRLRGNAQDSANIALATAVHGLMQRRTGGFDRGIKRAKFSVLTGVKHPAILLEGGFMSHPHEGKLINSETYIKKLGGAIADGVDKYRAAVTIRN